MDLAYGERKLFINKSVTEVSEVDYPMVQNGGYYTPENCRSRHKVAIIVPYRINIIEGYIKKSGAVKKTYKYLPNSKHVMNQIQDGKKSIVTSGGEIILIATNFYQQLYASQENTKPEKLAIVAQNNEEVPKFTKNKIECSIKSLRPEKAQHLMALQMK
ncbi:hypothetical protein KGM_204705 [Danaus plexippus plexippus]|uniref:Galactosyltransferase N-terminal domain-containing protein n=1 Tax=Danaus plexippus plexippus TaxID=278856 RepID=A0A212ER88_DANPL|nr:hypothetical protein KGM_204705 [Danaus plexippus plexippus]